MKGIWEQKNQSLEKISVKISLWNENGTKKTRVTDTSIGMG